MEQWHQRLHNLAFWLGDSHRKDRPSSTVLAKPCSLSLCPTLSYWREAGPAQTTWAESPSEHSIKHFSDVFAQERLSPGEGAWVPIICGSHLASTA